MTAERSRTVAELRPKRALALEPTLSVSEAAAKMQAATSDSALIVSATGELQGILTDTAREAQSPTRAREARGHRRSVSA